MSKYNWDVHELRKNREILKSMLKIEKDSNKKEFITLYIKMYNNLLNIVGKSNYNFQKEMANISLEEIGNICFENITDREVPIIELLCDSYSIIQNIDIEELQPFTIAISNDKLISNTEKFLQTYLDAYNYQKYIEFKEKNPNFLQIKKGSYEQNYGGFTYIDCLLKKKYIVLFRENSCMDLVSLPHECFHLIFNDYNNYISQQNQNYYSNEVEGALANLLVSDFYQESYPDISNEMKFYFFNIFKDMILSLIINTCYITSLNDRNRLRKQKFDKSFQLITNESITLSKEDVKQSLLNNMDELINYCLSYLSAIDLYFIYQSDPEFAIYLLQNIRYIKQEDDVIRTLRRNHITFMDDGYKNLKNYTRKLEKL